MKIKIKKKFSILVIFTSSLFGMSEYQIENNLTLEEKVEIQMGINKVAEAKRNQPAYFPNETEQWVSEIINGYVSPTKMRNGETILTHLLEKPDFGDLHFDYVRIINAMINAGAQINQENAHGLTPLTIAIKNGRKIVVGGMVQNGAYFDGGMADGDCNNSIRAGLAALKTAKLNSVPSKYFCVYQNKDCQMMMAYLINRVAPRAITKSQIHAAWKFGFKDVSWALAMTRKHPEKRETIVSELKKRICASLVREFKKI